MKNMTSCRNLRLRDKGSFWMLNSKMPFFAMSAPIYPLALSAICNKNDEI